MDRTDNILKLLVVTLSLLLLLIAIKISYPAENLIEMSLSVLGRFICFELILLVSIYVLGPMLSDSFTCKRGKGQKTDTHPVSDCKQQASSRCDKKANDGMAACQIKGGIEIPEDIIVYISKTFENILTVEQVEKLLENLRNFGSEDQFEVIEKVALPDYIWQFDLLHFVWNICRRIYDKRHSKFKFRDRAAEFAKSSFPLTVTSSRESIASTMTNEDGRNFSLPIIKPRDPLIPHNFSENITRKRAKS